MALAIVWLDFVQELAAWLLDLCIGEPSKYNKGS